MPPFGEPAGPAQGNGEKETPAEKKEKLKKIEEGLQQEYAAALEQQKKNERYQDDYFEEMKNHHPEGKSGPDLEAPESGQGEITETKDKQPKEAEKKEPVILSPEEAGKRYGADEEKPAEPGKVSGKTVDMDKLMKEIEKAKQRYAKKKEENDASRKKFRDKFKTELNLGEAEKEEKELEAEYKKKKEELEVALNQGKKTENRKENNQELSQEKLEEELKKMPESERKKLAFGLKNMGFFVQKWKSDALAKGVRYASNFAESKGTMGRFLSSLSETYKNDSKRAEKNIELSGSEESGKASRAMLQISNIGQLAGNVLKFGRLIADATGATTGMRLLMGGSMLFARVSEAAKEARFKNEKAMEKTRRRVLEGETEENIAAADKEACEKAEEEAWALYEKAQTEAGGEEPSKDALEKAYQRSIPEDILKRLSEAEPGVAGRIVERLFQKHIGFSVGRYDKIINKIENNSSLSDNQKKTEKDRILNKFSKRMKDWDRIVSQTGIIDTAAMGAKYSEMAGKAAVGVAMADTLHRLWGKLPELFSSGDIVGNGPESGPEGFDTLHGAESGPDEALFPGSESLEKQAVVGLENRGVGYYPQPELSGESPQGEYPAGEFPQGEIPKISLDVGGGSSLEGSIINHLKANPDLVEKYNALNGGRGFNAGQVAHRMALEFTEKNPAEFPDGPPNLIQPGTEIEINPENMSIADIKDSQGPGYLPEKEISGEPAEKIKFEYKMPEEKPKLGFSQETESKLESWKEGSIGAESEAVAEKEALEEVEIGKPEIGLELTPEQEKMADTVRDRLSFGSDSKWDQMEGLTREEAWKNFPEARERISDMNHRYTEIFGKEANAKPGETMEHWTARISQMAVKNEIAAGNSGLEEAGSDAAVKKGPVDWSKTEKVEPSQSETPVPETQTETSHEQPASQVEKRFSYPDETIKQGNAYLARGYTHESLEKIANAGGLDGKPAPGGRMLEVADRNGNIHLVKNDYESKMAARFALDKTDSLAGVRQKVSGNDLKTWHEIKDGTVEEAGRNKNLSATEKKELRELARFRKRANATVASLTRKAVAAMFRKSA